ncbi:MAG: ELM1/GtrOC1 family putative glycosyltransferase [Sphingomicrobium sp.]
MITGKPRVWALLGHRRGDNFQVLALAQALGLPFETLPMRYNELRRLDNRLLGAGLSSVVPSARQLLRPPWPDLVIGIGHRSVPVARYIRRASGGKTRLVQLGNPRIDSSHLDLVVTMPQYGLADSDQVLKLPFAMGSPHPVEVPTADERAILDALPRPHRLIVIGGPTRIWAMAPTDVAAAALKLVERAASHGGTVIAVGSPRTTPEILAAVEQVLGNGRHLMVHGPLPRYATLLGDADEIHVTADSVSMLSEAVLSGKPVGMIPLRLTRRGRWHYKLSELGLIKPPAHNLRAVWERLRRDQLIGTIDEPIAGVVSDPVEIASKAVLKLPGIGRP